MSDNALAEESGQTDRPVPHAEPYSDAAPSSGTIDDTAASVEHGVLPLGADEPSIPPALPASLVEAQLDANWVTLADGTVAPGRILIFPGKDATYEVEYGGGDDDDSRLVGLSIGVSFDSNHTVIQEVSLESPLAKMTLRVGDILLSVNNRDVTYEDLEDIVAFIDMIRLSGQRCRLKFLSVAKLSLEAYEKRMRLSSKSHKDVFGFIRTEEYLSQERQHQAARIDMSAQLDVDWVEYLKSIGGPINLKPYASFRPSPELKQLVRRGIPVALRPLIWPFISRTDQYRRQFGNVGYEDLVLRSASELEHRVRDDIEKDLDRTFPEHDYFHSPEALASLRRVLSAVAMKFPAIGYCQSMNFIAGALLLFMEEESSFWLMCNIIEDFLPNDYYTRTMIGTYNDQFVLSHLIKLTLPELHEKIQSFDMQLPLVAVEWFMCLFVNTLRPEVAFRVWDIFLNEGSKTLFRVAMAMLKRSEPVLLKCNDPGQFFLAIKNIGRDIINPDELISLAYKSFRLPDGSDNTTSRLSISRRPKAIRYATPSKAKSVPRDLIGIGLAHLGPKSLYSNVSQIADDADAEEAAQNYLTEVVVGSNYGSSSTRRNSQSRFSNPYAPSDFDDLDMSRNSVVQSVEGDVASLYRHQTKSRHKPRRKRDVYRNFGIFEITTWRNQFHPEVQARILSMEKVRNEYKRQKQSLEESSAAAQASAAPSNGKATNQKKDAADGVSQTHEPVSPAAAALSALSIPAEGDADHIQSHGSLDASEDERASCSHDEYILEGDDDVASKRLESIAKSPDVKMHDASPQLWQMLFEDRDEEEE